MTDQQLLNGRDVSLLNTISEVYGTTKALLTLGFDITDIIVERNTAPVIWVKKPSPAQCDLFAHITFERLAGLKDKDVDPVAWGEFRGAKVMWDFSSDQQNGDYRLVEVVDLRKAAA
ncbi:MAG: hypothetical protein RI964_828 [Pseudomonadota bacterium]|jgi:hypothetical protein